MDSLALVLPPLAISQHGSFLLPWDICRNELLMSIGPPLSSWHDTHFSFPSYSACIIWWWVPPPPHLSLVCTENPCEALADVLKMRNKFKAGNTLPWAPSVLEAQIIPVNPISGCISGCAGWNGKRVDDSRLAGTTCTCPARLLVLSRTLVLGKLKTNHHI